VHIRLTDKVSTHEGWAHGLEQYMQVREVMLLSRSLMPQGFTGGRVHWAT
jgi:hypothetical protein